MVHRLHDRRYLFETASIEVHPTTHHVEDSLEFLEVLELGRTKWVCIEERHDDLAEVLQPAHVEPKQILLVVVASTVSIDGSASEEVLQKLEDVDASFTLRHRKPRLHLPAQRHRSISLDRAAETAFAVDEADDPLLYPWPFLLIVRTGRIVTAHDDHPKKGSRQERVPPDSRSFQHLANCTRHHRWCEGQTQGTYLGFATLVRL